MVDNEDETAADRHRWIAAGFTERVLGTTDWDGQSPVAEWRARDVVRHLVEWCPAFLESGGGIQLPHGPSADDDPVTAWTVHAEGVQALLEDPEACARPFTNPHIGELPVGEAVDRFYTTDVFLHTWDLARATGQDDQLDAALCEELYAGMLPLDEMLRASGQYGPRVAVPDDADVRTKLFAFIGRDPYAG